MNAWKVILATLVIYSAGLVTGGLLVRQAKPTVPTPRPLADQGPMPWVFQQRFVERMRFELGLSPEQSKRIERIFIESRERTRSFTESIRPQLQAEVRSMHDKVLAELEPDQKRRFMELMKSRPPRGNNPPFGPPRRGDMQPGRRGPPPPSQPQEHSAPPP